MIHRHTARAATRLHLITSTLARRLDTPPERGQGTVEYVALILLVAGVLAAAVGSAGATGKSFKFGEVVTKELKQAIDTVSK